MPSQYKREDMDYTDVEQYRLSMHEREGIQAFNNDEKRLKGKLKPSDKDAVQSLILKDWICEKLDTKRRIR